MPEVIYETGTNRFERRIGRRVAITPFEVTVVPPGVGSRHSPESVVGLVTNVSVTGAALEVPASVDVTPEARATIRFEGHDSTVTVWRLEPASQPDTTRYGVEFTALHPHLRQKIYSYLADGRPAEHEWKTLT